MSSASKKLIQASGGGGPVDTGDDDFANVVLLLDGDGTSGDDNNTFTDSSTNGFTVTKSGSVIQGSFSPYGDNWSNYFGAAQSVVASNSAIAMGSGDWTLEFWVCFNAVNNGTIKYLFDWRTGSDTSNSFLAQESNNSWTYWNASGSGISSGLTSSTFSVGTWHHVALSRNGSTLRFFVDGTNVGSPTDSTTYDSSTITIGNRYTGSYGLDGYISNVRIVKGTALYTSAFTPPTDPLTAITNTELLTCQSNRFVDESTNNSTITLGGTPKVTPFSPFKNSDARDITTDGGSGYFNSSASLSVPDSTVFYLGAADFTIESWVNIQDFGSDSTVAVVSQWENGNRAWVLYVGPTNINFSYSTDLSNYNNNSASVTNNKNEWIHVAVTRSGNTLRIFKNGAVVLTTSITATISDSSKIVQLNTATNYGEGDVYISNLRVVNGTAVYTSAFTPPTSPLTAVTNTELLLNFQDAGIYDRTGLNNLDTVGNAQIDTAVKKYGTGSLAFDGSGDYLIAGENPDLAPGAGDFTVEFWMYGITNTFYNGLYHNYPDALNRTTAFRIVTNTADQTSLLVSTAATTIITTASGVVTPNAWNHVALVRNGSSLVLYVNGVSAGSTTNTTNFSDGYAIIGDAAYGGTNYFFNGYIDDFRLTKGLARYTANFTPPTAALPKF
jgi:hypothetical protein